MPLSAYFKYNNNDLVFFLSQTITGNPMYTEKLRTILANHSRLDIDFDAITIDTNLYEAGLTSLTTVNIMLAIEDEFDIEFPDSALNRKTFQSIETLADTVEELLN
jgi:acyl carrier protein